MAKKYDWPANNLVTGKPDQHFVAPASFEERIEEIGQERLRLGVDPLGFLEPLALGAMPITAGVVGDLLIVTLSARAPVTAQRGRAAVGDGPQDVLLRGAEPGERPRVLVHDIGEFHATTPERRSAHNARYGVGGGGLARPGSRSSGLSVSCREVVATWV